MALLIDKVLFAKSAAELFLQITTAVETLTDPAKKRIHDDFHRARIFRQERYKEMDEKRRTGKHDLDAREADADTKRQKSLSKSEIEKLEIERIRQQGNEMLLAKQQQVRQMQGVALNQAFQAKMAREQVANASPEDCTIKIKWPKELKITLQRLRELLEPYGSIETIKSATSGKPFAYVVFKTLTGAVSSINLVSSHSRQRKAQIV